MAHYKRYYLSTISEYRFGIKLVLGGTGLGKTRSIVDVLKDLAGSALKFIYIANRVQLLDELKYDIINDPALGEDVVIHQRSDTEVLLLIARNPNDTVALEDFLAYDLVKHYAEYLRFLQVRNGNLTDAQKAYRFIKSQSNSSSLLQSEEGNEMIRERTRFVMNFIKNVIRVAKDISDGRLSTTTLTSQDKERYSAEEQKKLLSLLDQFSHSDYKYLLNHSIVQLLFPYLQFKNDPSKRIFLVTLQKAFYGFFDGTRSVDLYHLDNQNGGYVIFMDEFDFLESDLIALLAKDAEISRPFKFVEEFYFAMTQNKLPYTNFLNKNDEQRKIQQDIKDVIKQIELLSSEYGINYPNINHFICLQESEEIRKQIKQTEKALKKARTEIDAEVLRHQLYELKNSLIRGNAIFQTRYTISPNRTIYLEEIESRPGSFNLTLDKAGKLATAYTLLDTVNQATAEIIRIFKDVELADVNLHRSLMRYCFDSSDSFQRILRQVRQYPLRRRKADSNYDKLQYNGFGMYEIHDLRDEFDPEEVYIRYYAIFTTPEKILHHLTKHNLVFGLSATAEIHRLVKNFDVSWLRKELQGNFIEPSADDLLAIANANQEKQLCRSNTLTVLRALGLAEAEALQQCISQTIDEIVRRNPTDDKGFVFNRDARHYRRNRIKQFFSTLFWAIENRNTVDWETDTHLLFFSSYRQIKYLFDKYPEGTDDQLWCVDKLLGDAVFSYYVLTLQEKNFIIIFYDAEKAREVRADEINLNRYYELFGQGKPVVLITTYASAGNGVNLQYHDAGRIRAGGWQAIKPNRDFVNVHLLDSPFYFFSPFDVEATAADQHATIKTNIYYLAKLMMAKLITQEQFKNYLSDIRGIGRFNIQYQNMPDGLLNQLAGFIQAIGRIERVWQPMPDQTIRLESSVYNIFEEFVSSSDYQSTREQLSGYFSNNLTELMRQIKEQFTAAGHAVRVIREEHLLTIDQTCRQSLQDLVARLTWVRQHPAHPKANDWRQKWERLRQSVLEHDFCAPTNASKSLLYEYSCVVESDYYDAQNQCLWIDDDMNIVPRDQKTYLFREWRINDVYTHIKDNDVIRRHFEHEGYELGFNTHRQYLTPYAYQALLAGAVGEECVKAVLLNNDILLAPDEIPNELYELADIKVRQHPWYIDAKNYSEHTLLNFSLDETDPLYHPKLNESSFQKRAIEKLHYLQQVYGQKDVKLIYINAFGTEDRPLRYFHVVDNELIDAGFDFQRAQIIFVFGLMNRNDPNQLLSGFTTFKNDLTASL